MDISTLALLDVLQWSGAQEKLKSDGKRRKQKRVEEGGCLGNSAGRGTAAGGIKFSRRFHSVCLCGASSRSGAH